MIYRPINPRAKDASLTGITHSKPEIVSGIFSIISDWKDFAKSSIIKRKKSEETKTPSQSKLEPQTIRSKIFGLSTWAICDLTNAGGKKIDETLLVTATNYLYQHCTCKQAIATHRDEAFVSRLRRETIWATESKIDPWDEFFRILRFSSMVFR